MFGQIGPTGRKVGGHFGQKCPKSENFVRTKMGGFGKFWDQTFIGIIMGPVRDAFHIQLVHYRTETADVTNRDCGEG